VFIKYTSSTAATRAIQWCLETGISAKHGFQRYCSKLLCNKACKRRNCPNLHQWASPEDIMDANEAKNFSPATKPKNKAKSKSPKHSKARRTKAKPQNQNVQSLSTPPMSPMSHQTQSDVPSHPKLSAERQGAILQAQYDRLQQQCSQQSLFINNLIGQLNTLSAEHRELRQQNSLLQHHSSSDLDEMVDDIVSGLGLGLRDEVEDQSGEEEKDVRDVDVEDQSGDSSSSNRHSSTAPDYSGGSSEDKGSNSSSREHRRQFEQRTSDSRGSASN